MCASLIQKETLPHFSEIDPKKIETLLENAINKNKTTIKTLLSQPGPFTWDNLMQPIEKISDELNQLWSPINHMHSVMQSKALRHAYNKTQPLLTDYHTELSQDETLYQAVLSIKESKDFAMLNPAQQKIIENDLRDFRLSGIHLPADKKTHMKALQKKLSQLTTKFSENVLDATEHWFLHLNNPQDIEGLPEEARQLAIENAKKRELNGYVLTLDYPSYSTAIKFLRHRHLRQILHEAYISRASDCGPDAEKWDNSNIMDEILKIRYDIAQCVGFKNYAEYSLATKMAKTPEDVLQFLYDLLNRSKPIAEEELKELAAIAKTEDNMTQLEAWDLSYYSEKYQQKKYQFSQEDLRPYFPIDKVLNGLFSLVKQLYGITICEEKDIDIWHPDVRFFSITDESKQCRGGFYIDLYARTHKRDGAWMDEYRPRHYFAGKLQLPIAFLTCNFMPPVNHHQALLTHDDVLTLFHEFGHSLHHLLTQVDYPSVAGINGVLWDAIEFPSQFMEYYCWEKKSLALISAHYQTGAPLPDDLYQKLRAAKNFQTGLQMIRQLEFALFDFKLHLEYQPEKDKQVQTILNTVRKESTIIPLSPLNRFQHSFAHIFGGGYAAGYYSYKWAEVLSADAYAAFEEHGIFDHATGLSFMKNILEVGGVRDPMISFIAFRGKKPSIDALLRQSGIVK